MQRLLLVAIQARHYKEVKKSCLVQGVCTITPSWFWKSKNTKVAVTQNLHLTSLDFQTQYQLPDEIQPSSSDIAAHFYNALLKIDPSITIMNASYPVLHCIVAS